MNSQLAHEVRHIWTVNWLTKWDTYEQNSGSRSETCGTSLRVPKGTRGYLCDTYTKLAHEVRHCVWQLWLFPLGLHQYITYLWDYIWTTAVLVVPRSTWGSIRGVLEVIPRYPLGLPEVHWPFGWSRCSTKGSLRYPEGVLREFRGVLRIIRVPRYQGITCLSPRYPIGIF